jgi:hypothetical protein
VVLPVPSTEPFETQFVPTSENFCTPPVALFVSSAM